MNYDISVIIPIYNAEKTLPECLGNLLDQTKRSGIELILVNDASTDRSPEICDKIFEAYGDRVVVINLDENSGPGAARNAGLRVARGEYIGFVDADDIVDMSMYEKLYESIVGTGADITDGAFFSEAKDSAGIHFSPELTGDLNVTKKKRLIVNRGYIFTKLYRKSLLVDNHIFFREAYVLEDIDFLIRVIMAAKKASCTMDVIYNYRDNMGSLSKEKRLMEYYDINMSAMEAVYEGIRHEKEYEVVRQAAEYTMACLYKNIVVKIIYERIERGGAFSTKQGISLLKRARSLKKRCIKGDISQNPYILEKLEENDILFMNLNDKNPEKIMEIADANR